MIQPHDLQTGPHAAPPLARASLLSSSLDVLDRARSLEAHAHRLPTHPQTLHLIERLASHREVLARRAANVALAATVTAEELRELREAASRLVAVHGWVTRKLGCPTRMS